jgi:hypothetical protein
MRVGLFQPFTTIHLQLQTPGVGGTATWQYWTGTAWSSIVTVTDGTMNLTRNGAVSFPAPSNWPKVALEGSTPFHWLRVLVLTAWTTPPMVKFVGVPIPGATLIWRGPALWQTTTSANGSFSSPVVLAGAYVVEFSAPGWMSFVYLAPVVGGQQTVLNIGPLGP